MERYAWRGRIAEGSLAEYVRRHDELWPEMTELLNKAGIHNYTIWQEGHELFGYYECEFGTDFAAKTQVESEIVAKWDTYMADILIMDKDPVTGAQPRLTQIFYHP